MISLTLGLTLGIIAATAVVIVMACIVVGAAADPLSRFDRTDELTSDAETQHAVREGIKWERAGHHGKVL